MGTSKSNTGGSGGAWTDYKRNATYFAKYGGNDRAAKALAGFVAAVGGVAAAVAAARPGVTAAQSLGELLAGSTGPTGVAGGLEAVGLGHLVGQDKFSVLSALLDAFTGSGGDLEAQAARSALLDVLDDLLPEDGEMEALVFDQAAVSEALLRYIAALIYNRAIPLIDERLTKLENQQLAEQRDKELRDYIAAVVRLRASAVDPLTIDWQGPEGQAFIDEILTGVYRELEAWS